MNLKERLEIAKSENRIIGILLGRDKEEYFIRGTVVEVHEDYCVIQPEGFSYYGFKTLVVPFSGIIFAGI
ncbi:MAG: hypothetical protein ACPL1G_00250 [Thermodesulfovibrionales bacterium]